MLMRTWLMLQGVHGATYSIGRMTHGLRYKGIFQEAS